MSKTATAPLAVPEKIGELAAACRQHAMAKVDEFAATLALAEGINQMRAAIAPLMPKIRALAGSPLGFRTDKQYPDETLAEAMIEAMVRGVRPVGNEFNVIGGRCYVTKEGYTRLVRELPGFTDLVLMPQVPKVSPNGAIVPYAASWKQDGRPMRLDRDIAVRLNNGQGVDAAIGKATRKMLAAIHGTVTGSVQSLAEIDAEDVEQPASRTAELTTRLAGNGPAPDVTPAPAPDGKLFGDAPATSPPD